MLDGIAERFQEFCDKPDPRPEFAAAVKRELRLAEARAERPSGAELAKRAIEDGKAEENARRSALGVQEPATARTPPVPFKVLNAPTRARQVGSRHAADRSRGKDPRHRSQAGGPRETKATTGSRQQRPRHRRRQAAVQGRLCRRRRQAAGRAAPPAGQKCRVWTASYGGQKAMIIRSVIDKVVNYTVLDVNEGAEKREADAFIAAYAKDGTIAGEFGSQSQALDKAFELCPEG